MTDHVYKRIDLTGTSTKTIEDAVASALRKAASTVHNIRWFEISEIRGDVEGDRVSHWQVSMKIGFTIDD